jgi:CRP/FNR family cyclic AMP-dependent transcriptional regulator
MIADVNILKLFAYFAGLALKEQEAVLSVCSRKKVARGDMVIREGEPVGPLSLVVSGAVKVFTTSVEGREQIINVVYPGGPVNDVAFFDHGPHPTSAQALSDAVICQINRSDMELVMQNNSQVARNVIEALAGRLRQMVLLVEDLSFKRVINRLARILLDNAAGGALPGRRLTQQEMAAMIGTAREVVSRSLRAMEEQGIIQMVQHRIVIRNREGMRQLAETAGCDQSH